MNVTTSSFAGTYKQKFKSIDDIYKLNDIKFSDLVQLNLLKNYMQKDCQKIQYNINAKNKTSKEDQSATKIQNVANIRNILFLVILLS